MGIDIGGVYRVDFPERKGRRGGEFFGAHYAVVLSQVSRDDRTLLVAPITGKKSGRKYRGGVTLDNQKYQENPPYDSSFVYIRKIQEIDKCRITFRKKQKRDEEGNILTDKNGKNISRFIN